MSLVTVTILGNELILGSDKDPPVGHRIGSVPLNFDNGKSEFVRVFGSVTIYTDSHERDQFESELRRFCALPNTIERVFGHIGWEATPKRFNPSRSQKDRGWYRAGKKCTEEFHSRCV